MAAPTHTGRLTYVLRQRFRYTYDALLRPTRLTAADTTIGDLAATMAGRDHVATAERICEYVHETISYAFGVTSVETSAAEALAAGRGVCQDSAHVMLALCKAAGLPA